MSNSRLFVGQLPSDITESEINEYFVQFGDIKDVFLPRSTKSKRIAFITYEKVRSVHAALAMEEPAQIRGETLNLSLAQPKGGGGAPSGQSTNESDSKRVFVNNIPENAPSADLEAFFAQWGAIKDVFYTAPRTYAYITFVNEADMFTCLANTLTFQDALLKCEVARPRPPRGAGRDSRDGGGGGGYGGAPPAFNPYGAPSPYGQQQQSYGGAPSYGAPQRQRQQPEKDNSRLFVGGVPTSVTEDDVRTYFGQFGTVSDCFRTKKTEVMFVTFDAPQGMYSALGAEQHVINDAVLRVVEAEPKPGAGGSGPSAPRGQKVEHRLFVGRIPQGVVDDDIRAHFSTFGTVEECYRPRNLKASKDGCEFGFVIFASARDMAKALSEPSHVVKSATLEVKRAKPRPTAPREDRGPGGPAAANAAYGGRPIMDVRDVRDTQQAPQAPGGYNAQAYAAYEAYAAQYAAAAAAAGIDPSAYFGQGQNPADAAYGGHAKKRGSDRYQPY